MKKITKKVGIIITFVVLIIFVVSSLWFLVMKSKSNESDLENTTVSVEKVQKQDPLSFEGKAKLQSDQGYTFMPDKGSFGEVYVVEGQEITTGDPLFSYYKDDIGQQIEELQRTITQLYNEREENKAIENNIIVEESLSSDMLIESEDNDEDVVSNEQEIVNSETIDKQIDDAEYELGNLQEQLYEVVYANNNGKVQINISGLNDGSIPYMRIVDNNTMIESSANEYELYTLKKGRKVKILVNATNETIDGEIQEVKTLPDPVINQNIDDNMNSAISDIPEQTIGAEGTLYPFMVSTESDVQPGFSVNIQITMPGYILPETAFIEEDDHTYVYRLKDDVTEKVEVKIEQQGLQKAVTGGLKEEDLIVIDANSVEEGQTVTADISNEESSGE